MDFVDVLLSLPGEDGREHMDDVEIKALIQVIHIWIRFSIICLVGQLISARFIVENPYLILLFRLQIVINYY